MYKQLTLSPDCNYNVIMKTRTAHRFAATKTTKHNASKAKLVRIGNSRGVRLPKAVIEQAGLTTDIEIAVRDNQIIIRSARNDSPRAGWEEQIKRGLLEHGEHADEEWLNAKRPTKFDEKEWTW